MLNKNLKTTKHNIMTAILINTINDFRVVVHSTTEHPSSSYGMPVWVDKDNEAYIQVGAMVPGYKVAPVDTLDQLASYINDYVQIHDKDWPDCIHEICDLNGWEDLENGEAHEIARCGNARLVFDNGEAQVWEESLKEYTAIYSTESIKNIQYSFKAENLDSAVQLCQSKFTAYPNIIIVKNTPDGKANEGMVVWANGEIVL